MELHTLENLNKKKKYRKGRGISQGRGKTAGRGQKGQKSRSGKKIRPGFEGGQTPLYIRIPKFGFKSAKKNDIVIVNLDIIDKFYKENETVSLETLKKKKIVKSNKYNKVKILGKGNLTKKIKFNVDFMSKTASDKISKSKK